MSLAKRFAVGVGVSAYECQLVIPQFGRDMNVQRGRLLFAGSALAPVECMSLAKRFAVGVGVPAYGSQLVITQFGTVQPVLTHVGEQLARRRIDRARRRTGIRMGRDVCGLGRG